MHIFDNRMVVIHPSHSKSADTRNASPFEDEGLEGFLIREGSQRYNFGFRHGLFFFILGNFAFYRARYDKKHKSC